MNRKYFIYSVIIIFCILICNVIDFTIYNNYHNPEKDTIQFEEFNESKYLSHKFYQNGTNVTTLKIERYTNKLNINNKTLDFYDYAIYYIPRNNQEKFYIEKHCITQSDRYIIIGKSEYIPVENTSKLYLFVHSNSISKLDNFGYTSRYLWEN